MTTRATLALLPALLLACNGGDTDIDENGDGLPDYMTQISGDDPPCEEFVNDQGEVCTGIEGATTFLVAEATLSEPDADGIQQVEGFFRLVIFPNQSWTESPDWTGSDANGQDSCMVTWQIAGILSDEDQVGCGACDKGLLIDQTMDMSLTDCPEGRVDSLSTSAEDVGWGLIQNEDGTAGIWDTRNNWGTNGAWNEDGFVVWSDGQCEWYGTGECS
jgi:hypothetical protein